MILGSLSGMEVLRAGWPKAAGGRKTGGKGRGEKAGEKAGGRKREVGKRRGKRRAEKRGGKRTEGKEGQRALYT